MGDRLGLPGAVYTGTCVQRCRVVGLREPRQSDGLTDLELDVKEARKRSFHPARPQKIPNVAQ